MVSEQQPFHSGTDTSALSTPGKPQRFTNWKILLVVVFMVLHFVSFVVDFYAWTQYTPDEVQYRWQTLVAVVAPPLLVRVFCLMWSVHDDQDCSRILVALSLGISHRYWLLLISGRKANKSGKQEDFIEVHQRESDACLLSLYSAFLKSAFQAAFQIQVMVEDTDWQICTALSASFSLVFLFAAVTWYDRDVRHYRAETKSVPWCGVILQGLWRVISITSRIVAMALTARITNRWILSGVLITVLILALYVPTLKRMLNLKEKVPPLEDFWHTLAVTTALTFGFINVYDRRQPKAPFLHSCLMLVLNVLPLWDYVQEECREGVLLYAYVAEGVVLGGQACGLLFMLCYDFCFYFEGPSVVLPFRIMHNEESTTQTALACQCGPHAGDTGSAYSSLDATCQKIKELSEVLLSGEIPNASLPSEPGDGSSVMNDLKQRIISLLEGIASDMPLAETDAIGSSDTEALQLGAVMDRLLDELQHFVDLAQNLVQSLATEKSYEDHNLELD